MPAAANVTWVVRGYLALWLMLAAGATPAQVAARVQGQVVDKAEAEALFQATFGRRLIDDAARPALQAQALEQAIDRVLVLEYLRREKHAASDDEIEVALRDFESDLRLQGMTLDEFLTDARLTRDQLRRKVAWETSWNRFLAKKLTDEFLDEFFRTAHAEFDGTEVRVSHLLLKIPKDANAAQRQAVEKQAQMLREQIASGTLAFDEAVQMHSQGTKAQGGDLGYIPRHGAMPEAFAAAAFRLKKGEVSMPVVTSFGVHLILCTDFKPGNKQLADVKRNVRLAAARTLFADIAARQRQTATIEYTGAHPYFKPGTKEVVTAP